MNLSLQCIKPHSVKSGILIQDGILTFWEYPKDEIGLAKYCPSFQLKIEEVSRIAISPRLILDDESLFILIITQSGKIYPIPDRAISSAGFKSFEEYFQLNRIQQEWERFEYEDHDGKYDKLIYPKEEYWKDLFIRDWKWKIRRLYSWIIPQSFFGNMHKMS